MSRRPGRLLVKYSDFAANVTGRVSISGRNTESSTDRWLDARMAPPVAGMFSAPMTCGRHSPRRKGPAMSRESWYCTRSPSVPSVARLANPAGDGGPGDHRPGFGRIVLHKWDTRQ